MQEIPGPGRCTVLYNSHYTPLGTDICIQITLFFQEGNLSTYRQVSVQSVLEFKIKLNLCTMYILAGTRLHAVPKNECSFHYNASIMAR